jgi:hypothetical protein
MIPAIHCYLCGGDLRVRFRVDHKGMGWENVDHIAAF